MLLDCRAERDTVTGVACLLAIVPQFGGRGTEGRRGVDGPVLREAAILLRA